MAPNLEIERVVTVGTDRYVLTATGLRLEASCILSKIPPVHSQPVLLFSTSDTAIDSKSIIGEIRRFKDIDDVFNEDFLSEVLLIHEGSSRSKTTLKALRKHLNGTRPLLNKQWRLKSVYKTTSSGIVPSGPYFLRDGKIFQVRKIHIDVFSSFQVTVLPDPGHSLYGCVVQNLDSVGPDAEGMSVAVPSRMYNRPSKEKPLAGVRIAIKDNFKLQGTKCSMGCRSFLETYERDEETADYAKMLIDLGAVIVGKTKMTAFASSEKPCDWWDFQCPFNPRGDEHLTPGGSSTGSATATAAYPWLDICIGTDTYGSVREPAAQSGVYGLRCSTDLWGSPQGLYPSSPVFDTVGFFGRSLEQFQLFSRCTLGRYLKEFATFPRSILYPTDFFPSPDEVQQHLVDNFVNLLESFLQVKKTSFSFAERWAQNPPEEAKGRSLAEYTQKSGYNPFYYDGYHEYGYFRKDHEEKFGKRVYVSPHMQWKWDLGAQVRKDQVASSLKELDVLRNWVANNILRSDDYSGSNAVLILPVGPAQPIYRDIYIPPKERVGMDALSLGAFLRIPQLVLPIGQSEYFSRVSGRKECLPIACSIAGAPGSDLMLIDLARQSLARSRFPTEVACGRYAFPPEVEEGLIPKELFGL
ncbi:amidase 1 [Diplogelasinospora grovesii]|uniref:Amidase 1 n=1 Tax=Diplogelasinospora grovesii TaxID=303347 RepID=A0AAN6NIQ1_9PEZI|nr:amidase 1 [Diplogelasinospora grovesii]